MAEPVCGYCDGERIACEMGTCSDFDGHLHPKLDAGRPLTPEEAAVGFWAMHEECKPKFSETIGYLRGKGVSLEVDGIEVHP